MSTSFPGTIDTFVNPAAGSITTSPTHAGQHTNINDAMGAVQNTLGTTGGTALFNSYGTADKPAKKNNETFGTPTITGGTINNAVLGTPTLQSPIVTLGSDATGDLFYRSSGGTIARLGIGTSTQVLTTNGTTPSWGTVSSATGLTSKIITGSRSMTASSGTVGYTGVGFTPTSIHAQMHIEAAAYVSYGFCDSAKTSAETSRRNDGNFYGGANLLTMDTASGAFQAAVVTSFDADGFTLTWTKGGSPGAATGQLYFICYK